MKIRELIAMDQRVAARYPGEILTQDGTRLPLTPMVPSDWKLLERFLKDVPDEERQFLRHDIADPKIVERWCSELDYRHTLPLLAWDKSQIVADGTLHQEPDLWTAHIGKIRLLVHPKYRRRGIGMQMSRHLVEVAQELGLHKVVAECVSEQAALTAFLKRFGFGEVARLPQFIQDQNGGLHDMLVMAYNLR